tara:strand:+ start:5169 stop:6062 length:894 start_codon:yes stop_codon:yes gene_type:complete
MKNKKIIITGALGQDGKILSKILLKKRYKVYGFLNKDKKSKIKNVIYKKINFKNLKRIKRELKKIEPSHVVHFGSTNPSYGSNNNFFSENYITTKNIIDAIMSVNKNINFIFPNSSHIFFKKMKVSEKNNFIISNSYTKFRIKIYEYMKTLKKKKFKFTNLILFNHDSIFRRKNFLLPRIVKCVIKNDLKSIKKIYKENIIEDFSHAEDICNGIYLLIKKNICLDKLILSSNKATKVNDIINYLMINFTTNTKINISVKKNINFIIGNNYLAKIILNWKIKKNIYSAVDEMYKDYVK